jgi:acyl-CoA synthetase (AMP-forming)/AMP-acid ligase II
VVEREVWLRGPQLFQGYRDDPDATAATLDADGWLHTGDLGTVDADGYVTLTGRAEELIKVRGFQVAPAAIEVLDELPRTMPGKLLRRVLVERERTAVAVSP